MEQNPRRCILAAWTTATSTPSEYALKFAQRQDHPATHKAVLDELRRRYATDWPGLLGTLFAHREACMLAALRALDRALASARLQRDDAAVAR